MGSLVCGSDTYPRDRRKELLGWPECLYIPAKISLPIPRKQGQGMGCGMRRRKAEHLAFEDPILESHPSWLPLLPC